MKKWLDNYFKNWHVVEQNRPDSQLSNDVLFYAPDWPLVDKKRLSLVITDFAAIFKPAQNQDLLFINSQGQTSFVNVTLADLIHLLESFSVSSEHFFYLLLLSYDFATGQLNLQSKDFYKLPQWYLLLPARGFLTNLQTGKTFFFDSVKPVPFKSKNNIEDDFSFLPTEPKSVYLEKIKQIKELIAAGEFYQLNYTMRFSKKINMSDQQIFQKWYQKIRAPFSFYLRLPEASVLSISPERFWFQSKDYVRTEPVKGTIARVDDPEKDRLQKQMLLNSPKDQAELNMITDLLRNDLSRVCLPGSVNVRQAVKLKTYPYVHHLVSQVEGKLQAGKNFYDLLTATFPGGSISGCPKIAAMKYINQFENHNRSFYTGSLFLRFPLQNVTDSSILIRTALLKKGWLHYQAGGGIIIDSHPENEYRECLTKAAPFLTLK